jgi:hypothetical protein
MRNYFSRMRPFVAAFSLLTLFLALMALVPAQAAPGDTDAGPMSWTVVADGLANPRGITFGPDGALYVAEAGSGGAGACIEGPEGQVCFGNSGAITRVTLDGTTRAATSQAQVVTGLPSLGAPTTGDGATGPHAVAFDSAGDMLLITGLGGPPDWQDASGPLGTDGAEFAWLMEADPVADSYTPWVNLAAFEAAENPDGGQLDTNPFGLVAVGDDLAVTDAGGNALLSVSSAGDVATTAVFPARMIEFPPGTGAMIPSEAVPTGVVVGPDGAFYVSQLTGFPFPVGEAAVWRVEPGGSLEVYAGGFSSILGIDFAADGSLYVLEMFTNGQLSGSPVGRVVHVATDGTRTTIAREGLILPTGIAVGPDQAVYVSNFGVSGTMGQVVRIPTTLSEATQFSAILSGDQEVPPVTTDASGVARFTLAGDKLTFEVAVRSIDNITASHIHLAPRGENGGVVFPLYTGTGDFDPDNPISGELTVTPENIDDLLAGNYYVNVHTSDNPPGEIRGQIYPAHTTAYMAGLSGANEVPPVMTDASGKALFTLSPDMTTLYFRVMVSDIDNITASHIHQGAPDANGPVVFPLYGGSGDFDPDNPVSGTLSPDLTQVAAMLAGEYYVNVHTSDHPSGEIRGQIGMYTPPSDYSATLSGDQEVPPVTTEASGMAHFGLSADLSLLDFHVMVSDIDNITASHLHTGWPGQNGPVALALYMGGPGPFDPDNPASGLLDLSAENVLDLISGYYYVNVHTSDFPAGEIRGQVGPVVTMTSVYLPVVAAD